MHVLFLLQMQQTVETIGVVKKILVLSDSHGNVENMIYAVRMNCPDMIIHLGDCWGDSTRLHAAYPGIPMERVPGNCDYQQEPEEKILLVEGKKILICHGHRYAVKSGYLTFELAAREKCVDMALCGHTHRVFYDRHNGVALFNPGSIGSPGFGNPPSYGILTLDKASRQFQMDVKYIEMGAE